jgi:hypothetical protein
LGYLPPPVPIPIPIPIPISRFLPYFPFPPRSLSLTPLATSLPYHHTYTEGGMQANDAPSSPAAAIHIVYVCRL